MKKQYDLVVFPGRFQPFHEGHFQVLCQAASVARTVCVLLGSATKARNFENPFTNQERIKIIKAAATSHEVMKHEAEIIFAEVSDNPYNDHAWVADVTEKVLQITGQGQKIALIGANKDADSFWLKLFPHWDLIEVPLVETPSATDYRERIYNSFYNSLSESVINGQEPFNTNMLDVPAISGNEIKSLIANNLPHWLNLAEEFKFCQEYKNSWAVAPYPVKHLTVDSVVICAGHILLVRRRSRPGKGMWALPGGHLGEDERFDKYAAIRELREETKIRVPEAVLAGSVKASGIYDHPRRSLIGRVITRAFLFEIQPVDNTLPKVKGADDADKARWVLLNELKEADFYDDHYFIIKDLLGLC